jgi:hypothetical protein
MRLLYAHFYKTDIGISFMKHIFRMSVLLTILFLAACGQKGPLYLPPHSADAASAR